MVHVMNGVNFKEFLTTKVAKQNIQFGEERDMWKAEAERLQSGYDAQRLRADTAEAELRVTKQAIASLKNERDADDRKFKCLGEILGLLKDHPIVKAHQLHIDAALNPKPEAGSHE